MFSGWIGNIILYIVSIIFIVIGIESKKEYSKKEKCFKEIIGIVVGNRRVKTGKGYSYYVIVKYEIGKLDYTVEYLSAFETKLGTQVKLLYNPNKVNEAIIKNDDTYLRYLAIGIMLFLIAISMTFLIPSMRF